MKCRRVVYWNVLCCHPTLLPTFAVLLSLHYHLCIYVGVQYWAHALFRSFLQYKVWIYLRTPHAHTLYVYAVTMKCVHMRCMHRDVCTHAHIHAHLHTCTLRWMKVMKFLRPSIFGHSHNTAALHNWHDLIKSWEQLRRRYLMQQCFPVLSSSPQ